MKKSIIPASTIAMLATALFGSAVSALEYQTTADVSFTFRPFINVNLSGDLVINNLAPGSYADSNIITVGVSTNASSGYVMQATAGTNTTNTRLVNTDNSNFYFSSLGTSDTVTSMNSASDNTWGFSYSDDDGTTWISAPDTLGYSGLPLDANTNADERGKGGKTLLDTDGTTGDQSIQFKIGAKAATTQAAGTYTNIINFYAVANPEPTGPCASSPYIMQDVNTWESTVTTGNEVTACDNRDGKEYTVARLADGNIWMTQNLDFDIVNAGADLDSTNTDVPSNWTDAGDLIDTYVTGDNTWYAVGNSFFEPESYDPGDLCWDVTIAVSGSVLTTCTDYHYHIGNYYNWTAAVATADSSSYTAQDVDVNQSICPAGWTLPKGGDNSSSGSFAYLISQQNLTMGVSGNIHQNPSYFIYSGRYNGIMNMLGYTGAYWSSTNGEAVKIPGGFGYEARALGLYLSSGTPESNTPIDRDFGLTIRCVSVT